MRRNTRLSVTNWVPLGRLDVRTAVKTCENNSLTSGTIHSIDIPAAFKHNIEKRKTSKTSLDPIATDVCVSSSVLVPPLVVASVVPVAVVDAVVVVVGPVVVDVVTKQKFQRICIVLQPVAC